LEEKPLVTIVIPTYNRADKVTATVRSVLNQTYDRLEVIVVDDGSKDGTEEKLATIRDERFRYLAHQQNRGGSAARNTGLEIAQGDYLAFLDDDDRMMPDHLSAAVGKLEELSEKWGVVHSGKRIIIGDRERISLPHPSWKGEIFSKILVRGSPGMSNCLFRYQCFKKVGKFDPNFPRHQDLEMHLRIAKEFLYWPIRKASIQKIEGTPPSAEKVLTAKRMLWEKFERDIKELNFTKKRQFYSQQYHRLGKFYFNECEFLQGSYWFLRGVIQNPFRIKHALSSLKQAFFSIWNLCRN